MVILIKKGDLKTSLERFKKITRELEVKAVHSRKNLRIWTEESEVA